MGLFSNLNKLPFLNSILQFLKAVSYLYNIYLITALFIFVYLIGFNPYAFTIAYTLVKSFDLWWDPVARFHNAQIFRIIYHNED